MYCIWRWSSFTTWETSSINTVDAPLDNCFWNIYLAKPHMCPVDLVCLFITLQTQNVLPECQHFLYRYCAGARIPAGRHKSPPQCNQKNYHFHLCNYSSIILTTLCLRWEISFMCHWYCIFGLWAGPWRQQQRVRGEWTFSISVITRQIQEHIDELKTFWVANLSFIL